MDLLPIGDLCAFVVLYAVCFWGSGRRKTNRLTGKNPIVKWRKCS